MNKFFVILSLGLLCLLAVMILRTFMFQKPSGKKPFIIKKIDAIKKSSLENLSGGLKFKTVSNVDYNAIDFKEYDKFIAYIEKTYPLIFKNSEFEKINNYALIFKLKGTDSSKKPILLTAHYDVVPIRESDLKEWKFPPFSGHFDEENIYSRGTIDDKSSFFAIMEALNNLLEQGFKPQSDIYFASSHVEEVGSKMGAEAIAKHFKAQNVEFDIVLDEGKHVSRHGNQLVAQVGFAEKGRIKTKITIKSAGGHASMPQKNSSVAKIAKLITAFENSEIKPDLTPGVYEYYKNTFGIYDFCTRFLIANKWLLKPLLIAHLSKNKEDYAALHSTTALTMINASNAANVISEEASLVIDTRILPTQSCADIKRYVENIVKKTFKNAENIKIEYFDETEPSAVSSIDSNAYKKLSENISALYEGVIVTPALVLAGTDAREYNIVSQNVYRFLPIILTPKEYGLMHSNNERISVENFNRMIYFYENLIKTWN